MLNFVVPIHYTSVKNASFVSLEKYVKSLSITMLWYRKVTRTHTEYSDDFFILNDFERAGDNETEHIKTFALVKDHVARSAVDPVEMYGQSAQTAAACQAECRVVGKHRSVQMYAEVRFHVLRAAAHDLLPRIVRWQNLYYTHKSRELQRGPSGEENFWIFFLKWRILVYFIFLSDGGAPKRRGARGNLPSYRLHLYPFPSSRRPWLHVLFLE